MALDQEIFERTIESIGPLAGYPSELPQHISTWLDGLSISSELKDFLTGHSASSHYEVGPIAMLPHRNIYSESREFPFVIEAGFLVVGASGSGDPLLIDLRNEEVGFISHESLWSYSSAGDLRADFKPVASSLGICIQNAHASIDFPADYHEA